MTASALAFYVLFATVAAVHDDEPTFADPGRELATGGGVTAPVLEGLLPGAGERLMWQPPGYFFLLAGWFRVLGFGLLQGRTLSAIGVAIALGSAYLLARQYASPMLASVAVAGAGLAPWVLQAATTIRPDAWTLGAVSVTLVAAVAWSRSGGRIPAIAVAIGSSVAMLFHPIGIIAPAAVAAILATERRWLSIARLAVIVAIVVGSSWGLFVIEHWSLFIEQMNLQGSRKSGFAPLALITSQDRLRIIGYVPLLLVVGAMILWRCVPRIIWPSVVAVAVAAIAATLGMEEQYPAFLIVSGIPLVAFMLRVARERSAVRFSVLIIALVIGLVPAAVIAARDLGSLGLGRQLALLTGGRPVFLGPGAAAVYFETDPDSVRVFSAVPTEPGAVERVIRRQGLLISRSDPNNHSEISQIAVKSQCVDEVNGVGVWRVR